MPKSRNRKQHKTKLQARKNKIAEAKKSYNKYMQQQIELIQAEYMKKKQEQTQPSNLVELLPEAQNVNNTLIKDELSGTAIVPLVQGYEDIKPTETTK